MRRIVLLFFPILMFLTACTKEQETTYTFKTEGKPIAQILSLFNAYGYVDSYMEIYIFEYYGDQRVGSNVIKEVRDDIEYTFVASPKAEYLTVRVELLARGHATKPNDWITDYIANAFYLTPNSDTDVVFSTETLVSDTEPKL